MSSPFAACCRAGICLSRFDECMRREESRAHDEFCAVNKNYWGKAGILCLRWSRCQRSIRPQKRATKRSRGEVVESKLHIERDSRWFDLDELILRSAATVSAGAESSWETAGSDPAVTGSVLIRVALLKAAARFLFGCAE